jgi:hypothetical protein
MRIENELDAGFIRRVYRTSILLWVLVAWLAYGQWGGSAAAGVTTGTALALGSLYAWERAIRILITPGASRQAPGLLMALGGLKLLLIGAILAGVIVTAQRLQANLLALTLGIAGGFFLVHLVILLKAVSRWLLDKGVAVTAADRPRIG